MRRFFIRTSLRLLLTVGLASSAIAETPATDYPTGPIQVIVPFGAGGNSDTVARIIQRAIADHQLLPEPLVIQNVPGAGGTIGSRRALLAEPNGQTLLFLHEGMITASYSGAASWGWQDFEPIAATGRNGGIVAVHQSSPFKNLDDLLEQAAGSPDTVTFATNIGAPAHFWAMGLENAKAGARFRYVQTGGGAARFHALKGNHVEATAFSVAEFLSYRDGGLRALAVLSEARDEALPDVPTAREQGIDLIASNLQCWWAPKGTDPEKLSLIAGALKQAMETPDFSEFADRQQIEPLFLSGEDFSEELARRETLIASVAPRAIAGLPDVPAALALLTVIVGIGAFMIRPKPSAQQGKVSHPTLLNRRAISLVLLTFGYGVVLGLTRLPFFLPTFLFLLAGSWLLSASEKKSVQQIAALIAFAAVISLGLPWVFGNVFGLSLP